MTPAANDSSKLTVLLESLRNRQEINPPMPVPPTPASAVIPITLQIIISRFLLYVSQC